MRNLNNASFEKKTVYENVVLQIKLQSQKWVCILLIPNLKYRALDGPLIPYTHYDEHGTVTVGRYQDSRATMGHLISNF